MSAPIRPSSPAPMREISAPQINENKIMQAIENKGSNQLTQARANPAIPTEKPAVPLQQPPIQKPLPHDLQALAGGEFCNCRA